MSQNNGRRILDENGACPACRGSLNTYDSYCCPICQGTGLAHVPDIKEVFVPERDANFFLERL